MTIVASPEPTTTKPLFDLSTDDAITFMASLTLDEAKDMLGVFLAVDETRFIRLMGRVQANRARYAEAVTR